MERVEEQLRPARPDAWRHARSTVVMVKLPLACSRMITCYRADLRSRDGRIGSRSCTMWTSSVREYKQYTPVLMRPDQPVTNRPVIHPEKIPFRSLSVAVRVACSLPAGAAAVAAALYYSSRANTVRLRLRW